MTMTTRQRTMMKYGLRIEKRGMVSYSPKIRNSNSENRKAEITSVADLRALHCHSERSEESLWF
jgi:hypothetical protein